MGRTSRSGTTSGVSVREQGSGQHTWVVAPGRDPGKALTWDDPGSEGILAHQPAMTRHLQLP